MGFQHVYLTNKRRKIYSPLSYSRVLIYPFFLLIFPLFLFYLSFSFFYRCNAHSTAHFLLYRNSPYIHALSLGSHVLCNYLYLSLSPSLFLFRSRHRRLSLSFPISHLPDSFSDQYFNPCDGAVFSEYRRRADRPTERKPKRTDVHCTAKCTCWTSYMYKHIYTYIYIRNCVNVYLRGCKCECKYVQMDIYRYIKVNRNSSRQCRKIAIYRIVREKFWVKQTFPRYESSNRTRLFSPLLCFFAFFLRHLTE